MALSKTARFYRKNRASYLKKLAKANSHPVWGEQTKERKKKRVESNRIRRAAKRNGKNIDGKDYDHKTGTFMDSSKNRGQRERSRKKGSKRNKRMFGKAIKGACK
jgi:glyceraldehyde-3-phosphate dehydrogenase/erythrose-4-phosphate dehydrogenase